MWLKNNIILLIKKISIQKTDLTELFDKANFGVFWPVAIAFIMIILVSSLEHTLITSEKQALGLLKPEYTAVSFRSEYRTSGRVEVSLNTFNRLIQLDPEMTALLSSETEIEFSAISQNTDKLFKKSVPIILTSDAFFKAAGGKLMSGKVFETKDVQNGKAIAVITSGLAKELWGERDQYSKNIFIQGREIELIGNWEFEPNTLEENHTLILPISLAPLVSNANYTLVSRFIIKGNDSFALTKLKEAIDQIQLDMNRPIDRPIYRISVPSASGKNGNLWKTKKIPAEIATIMVTVFALILAGLSWDRAVSQCPDVIAWRRWITNDASKVRNDIFIQFIIKYMLWIFIAFVISWFLVHFAFYLFKTELLFSINFSLSNLIIIFLIPILIWWITDLRVKKEIRLVRWM